MAKIGAACLSKGQEAALMVLCCVCLGLSKTFLTQSIGYEIGVVLVLWNWGESVSVCVMCGLGLVYWGFF